MKRKPLIILCCLISGSSFAFSFNSIFGSHHRSRPHKKSVVVDYRQDKANYDQYCTHIQTDYGIQINCNLPEQVSSFKYDASATVKCKQQVKGISSTYPNMVQISTDYIETLNLCDDEDVYGPYFLHSTTIIESGALGVMQKNYTETIYDVVCANTKGGESYVPTIYATLQNQYESNQTQNINTCISNISVTTSSSNYILVFKIFFGLAVISFFLRFYFKYKNAIHRFFNRLRKK